MVQGGPQAHHHFGDEDISTPLIYAKITTRKRLEDVARYLEGSER